VLLLVLFVYELLLYELLAAAAAAADDEKADGFVAEFGVGIEAPAFLNFTLRGAANPYNG
jgi:hypothetical protein